MSAAAGDSHSRPRRREPGQVRARTVVTTTIINQAESSFHRGNDRPRYRGGATSVRFPRPMPYCLARRCEFATRRTSHDASRFSG
jgi:hypothetical protein